MTTPSTHARERERARLPAGTGLVAAGAVVALLVALCYWRIWDDGLRAPIVYSGDGLLYQRLAKTIVERGWYLTNPLIGAPGGQALFDYPLGGDNLHFVVLRGLALVTSNPFALVNTYYYLTFPLVFACACYAFRRLGMAFVLAVPLSVLYALAPFHFSRSTTHLFLSAYYAAPLACLLLYELLSRAETRPEGPAPTHDEAHDEGPLPVRALLRSRTFWLGRWLWIPVILASTGAYYAFFFVILAGGIGVLATIYRRDLRQLALPALLIGITLGTLFLNNLPTFVYRAENGPNPVVAQRKLGEADINALQWSTTVLPIQQHRLKALADLRAEVNQSISPIPPRGQDALGGAAAVGFLIAVGALVLEGRSRGLWASLRRRSGALIALAVLLGSVGGASFLLGLFGFLQLRAYDRLVVFIGFCSLVALGASLAPLLERTAALSSRRVATIGLVAIAGVAALAWFDHTPATDVGRRFFVDSSAADRQLATSIERRMGPDAMVLEIPLLGFPEDAVLFPAGAAPLNFVANGMEVYNGYELFRPSLYTDTVRWSYGRIQARPGDVLPSFGSKPVDVFLADAVAAGFDGMYIDRTAFPDYAAQLEAQLVARLGPPALESTDGLRVFFDLRAYAEQWRASTPPAEIDDLRRNATHPLDLDWSEGFLPPDGIGRFFPQTPGFTSGRSATDGATLEVTNPSPEPRVLKLHASARLVAAGPAQLTVAGGGRTAEAVVGPTPGPVTFQISVAPGTTRLTFATVALPQPGAEPSAAHPAFRLEDVWWQG